MCDSLSHRKILPLQRTLQLGLRHLRAPGQIAALRLLIELGSRRLAATRRTTGAAPLLAVARGRGGPLAPLGAAEVALVLLLALVFRGARLAQGDRDRLLRVLHLAAARGLELAMLELVHDALDRFLLPLRLLRHHRLHRCSSTRTTPRGGARFRYSGLISASLMTFPHFSVSAAMCRPNAS